VSSTPAVVQRSQDETPYLDHGRTAAVHKRVTRSILSSLLLNIFANGFLYAGQLIIARSLTRNEYADYVVAINFVTLFALFRSWPDTHAYTNVLRSRRAQSTRWRGSPWSATRKCVIAANRSGRDSLRRDIACVAVDGLFDRRDLFNQHHNRNTLHLIACYNRTLRW
jgi:hypothetical protein